MRDREWQVSMGCAVAYVGWVSALIMWGVSYFTHQLSLGHLSLIMTAGAVTATIRCFMVTMCRRLKVTIVAAIETGERASVRILR